MWSLWDLRIVGKGGEGGGGDEGKGREGWIEGGVGEQGLEIGMGEGKSIGMEVL